MCSQNLLLKVLCPQETIPKTFKENWELLNNMAFFLFTLIFAQRILSGRVSCHTLLNWLDLLSRSTDLVLLIHNKWQSSLSCILATALFFFSFVSRNCFAWPLTLLKLLSVMTNLWYISLSLYYCAVCNLKTVENTVLIKCLHLSNSILHHWGVCC